MAQGSLTETLRGTLALFTEAGEPLTTTEVADRLDLGRRAAYGRLERLAESERLESKKVGASGRVWWRPGADAASPDWPAAAESLIDDVLDGVEVGIFVLDENFDVAWINAATERYFGIDGEDVLGRDKRRLVDERIAPLVEDSETFAETVLGTYDDNTGAERFECHVTPGENGEGRWLEHRSKPIETGAYAGGRVELYYDVTERKESERARRKERQEFASLVGAVEEYAIFTLDADGYVRTWNPGAERIKGYATDEIVGEHFSTFYTDEAVAAGAPERNLAAAAAEGSVEDEGWRVRDDGSRFWANVTISAIRDDDGEPEGYAKVTRDMTDRRESEQRLREEKAFTESILDNQADVVYAFDTEGEFLRWNDRFREVTGYTDAEIEERRPADFVADDAADDLEAAIERMIEGGESGTIELPLVTKAGEEIPYRFTGGPLTEDGAVVGVTGIGRDISDERARRRRLERQRDELEAELGEIFERVDDAFYAVDDEMRLAYVNDRAEALFGHSAADLLGRTVWDALSIPADDPIREQFRRAMATQEPTTFERYSEPLGIWETVRVYPSTSGLSVYFTDITEEKERERELEEFERIVETVGDGIYVLDEARNFQLVNDAFVSMTQFERPELVGSHASTVFGEKFDDIDAQAGEQFAAGEVTVATFEEDIYTAGDDTITVENRFSRFDRGGEQGRVGVIRDITDRKRRERELEESRRRYQTLVDNFPNGVVALVDEDLRYVTVGGTPLEDAGVTIDDLVGSPVDEILPDDLADLLVPRYADALDGEASSFERTTDDVANRFHVVPVRDDDGEVFAAMGMSQDVTDQREREWELRDAKLQLEAATEAGAVGTWEWNVPEDEFVAGESFARTFGVDPDEAREGVPIGRYLDAVHADDRDQVQREIQDALASCGEYEAEYRVENAEGEYRWVVARGHVECEDGEPVTFPGALTDITDRKVAELELERQREQLAALNSLNEVARDITRSVIDQSTREEIEETVCRRLAEADSYLFAWTGEVDTATQTVSLRAEAGVEGYLDDVTISVDPDDEHSEGATGRALRTGEIQVTNDIRNDSRYDPWLDHIKQHSWRSSAAIPIVHEGTTYGVLNVYAARPNAFSGQEREVIAQLGEVVGHAIAAAERKQALMSEELVELEFQIRDVFATLDVATDTEGRITLDHAVPIRDGEFLVFGTATQDALETVVGLTEAVPHWESVTVHSKGDPAEFELRVTDPPVLSVVASLGGYVDQAVIEDGDYRMRIHLAPSVEVRKVIETMKSTYPTAEMHRRRQISRQRDDVQEFHRRILSDLTDRQHTALETAYHAGFFEWPRDTSGNEVADLLGVASPTFHQHLRKAERKVFDAVFSEPINGAA